MRVFAQDKEQERKDTLDPQLVRVLRNLFPSATGYTPQTSLQKQMRGQDIHVNFPNGSPCTVDLKFRNTVYPDIALEYAHHYFDGSTKLGWVADLSKDFDYIGYVYKPNWLCYLIPRAPLQGAWQFFGDQWKRKYGIKASKNYNEQNQFLYDSLNCPVPREIIINTIPGCRIADPLIAENYQRPGKPFEHYCECGKWGLFGFSVSIRSGKDGRWYCSEHKPML